MRKIKTKEQQAFEQALDGLIARTGHSPEAIMGSEGLLAQLTKALVERVPGAELTHHIRTGRSPSEMPPADPEHGFGAAGEPDPGPPAPKPANCRNGFSKKTVIGDSGELEIAVPRDRQGSFEPLLVPKWRRRMPGFEEKIIALYARGMTVRDIQALLQDQYRIEISPDFISEVTDAVQAEVTQWQNRPLDRSYPLVFLDALRVRIRDEGTVRNKAVYLALAVSADGTREVLGDLDRAERGGEVLAQGHE